MKKTFVSTSKKQNRKAAVRERLQTKGRANSAGNGLCWHYTVGLHIDSIGESQVLRLADRYMLPGERPAVWFSTNPIWEPTANKRHPNGSRSLTKEETEDLCDGLFRIGVAIATAPHDWAEFQQLSGLKEELARGLAASAEAVGAQTQDWRVSFVPVPSSDWVSVERWDGTEWVPFGERV